MPEKKRGYFVTHTAAVAAGILGTITAIGVPQTNAQPRVAGAAVSIDSTNAKMQAIRAEIDRVLCPIVEAEEGWAADSCTVKPKSKTCITWGDDVTAIEDLDESVSASSLKDQVHTKFYFPDAVPSCPRPRPARAPRP